MNTSYCIRIQGRLDDRWSEWFEGLSIQRLEDGTTELVGEIVDQATLHGVIARIRDLGLPLISVGQQCHSIQGDRKGDASGTEGS